MGTKGIRDSTLAGEKSTNRQMNYKNEKQKADPWTFRLYKKMNIR